MENAQKIIDKLSQLNQQNPIKNIIEIELMLGYTIKLYEELLVEKNNLNKPPIKDSAAKPIHKEEVKTRVEKVKDEQQPEPKEAIENPVTEAKEDSSIHSIGDIAKKFVNNIITKINPQEKENVTPITININEEKKDEKNEQFIGTPNEEEAIILKIDENQENKSIEEELPKPEPNYTSGISFEPPPTSKIVQATTDNKPSEPPINKIIAEPIPAKPVSAQGFIAPKVDKAKEFKSLIGLNDKILYVNELFGKDQNAFDIAVTKINDFPKFTEAKDWIDEAIATAYLWDRESSAVEDFYTLVEHFFKSK